MSVRAPARRPVLHLSAALAWVLAALAPAAGAQQSEPDPGTLGRVSYWPRGKVLGGSSSINAMVYIRGQAEDFDGWAALGNPGWGWRDVLPYFKKSEDSTQVADEFHGVGGETGRMGGNRRR